ncbi:MAG: aminopeptidase P N-terminal domain-containing protein [Bacteroidota bacterium]|nr:aminopeptidase P N-terminal domain-containing protein [Bacteroidota bacterium]
MIKKIVFFCLIYAASLAAQDLKYLEYDTDFIPPAEYKARRDSLMKEIGENAVAVFYSAPERVRNGDQDYPYHQNDNFYYLTGFPEPNAILFLIPSGTTVHDPSDSSKEMMTREILFVQPREPLRERWTGRRYGPEGAMALRGVTYALTNDKFKTAFMRILFSSHAKRLYVPPFSSDFGGEIKELMQPVQNIVDRSPAWHSTVEVRDPSPLVYSMRVVKSPEEIALIRKAAHISAVAHNQAMMSCEPEMHEYDLQALYLYVFHRMGAEDIPYPCIVGSAENSVILHYETDRREIHDGDLVLADCAAEYHNYASDVTRTYPVNGTFTEPQKQIYQIVLDAQTACIAMMKPGASWRNIQAKAEEVITDGLFKLGIIKEKSRKEMFRFFMHGVGHPVGLNVHDAGRDTLVAGMVMTAEPGIYIAEGSEGVDPKYFNIGVRLEDDILVTSSGHEILSNEAPREIKDVEALMKKKGIGNQPLQ